MLTIFSTPKAFLGHIATIQRNAIGSWIRISPSPQVVLFGDSEGTREAAAQFGVEHIPAVEANEFGTPYLRSLIDSVERLARHDLLCYVNGDIIFTEGFEQTVQYLRTEKKPFLLSGRRMNVDVNEPIPFHADWRAWLQDAVCERGVAGDHTYVDFFVFRKGFYKEVPPLVIGRAGFDEWMIKAALDRRAKVIDASRLVPILHQNHSYSHVDGGRDWVYRGVEAERNRVYCERAPTSALLDCTHELAVSGSLRRVRFRRTLYDESFRHALWRVFVQRTVGLRHKLKLRRRFWSLAGNRAG